MNLQLIHELWKNGTSPNRVADRLNEKKIRPRCAQKWNRNSIIKIINRLKTNQSF
ncbi:MAG: recombinase family protein [Pseudobdellovibrio sp.]